MLQFLYQFLLFHTYQNMIQILIISLIITLGLGYIIFLQVQYSKVNRLERQIKNAFLSRSSLIPSFFEVTAPHLMMHTDIFAEILKLRKKELSQVQSEIEMFQILQTKDQIHHELNFIFTTSVKHPALLKNWKFIYVRELLLKQNAHISNKLDEYKKAVLSLNNYIDHKKFSIIGIIIPMTKKIEI